MQKREGEVKHESDVNRNNENDEIDIQNFIAINYSIFFHDSLQIFKRFYPNWHLVSQIKQWKHQNNL